MIPGRRCINFLTFGKHHGYENVLKFFIYQLSCATVVHLVKLQVPKILTKVCFLLSGRYLRNQVKSHDWAQSSNQLPSASYFAVSSSLSSHVSLKNVRKSVAKTEYAKIFWSKNWISFQNWWILCSHRAHHLYSLSLFLCLLSFTWSSFLVFTNDRCTLILNSFNRKRIFSNA